MYSKNNQNEKIPLGQAAGETSEYAVSLVLFLICGVWIPHRNFSLITVRIGQGGDLPAGSQTAHEIVTMLYNWQGFLIAFFIILVIYFWWSSTWQMSAAKKGSRFLLWCIPAGLYILMLWILYWLQFPLIMAKDSINV